MQTVNEQHTQLGRHARFQRKDRKQIRTEIRRLHRLGFNNIKTSEALNKSGYSRPNGEPCDARFVSNQKHRMSRLGRPSKSSRKLWSRTNHKAVVETSVEVPVVQRTNTCTVMLESMSSIMRLDLTDEQKVHMVRLIVKA